MARNNKWLLGIIAAILIFMAGYQVFQNSHVRFADENMGLAICAAVGSGVTPENVKYKDLKKIQRLNAGYLGNFDTLKDIKKCRNIEELLLNGASFDDASVLAVNDGQTGKVLDVKEVRKMEQELSGVIPKLNRLHTLVFTNVMKNCDITDWNFLKKCRRLENIYIMYSGTTDFPFLEKCPSLREAELWGSSIEKADSLLGLKGLEKLSVYETPLSKNEEEIQKLCKGLNDTEIFVSTDRIENQKDRSEREKNGQI